MSTKISQVYQALDSRVFLSVHPLLVPVFPFSLNKTLP